MWSLQVLALPSYGLAGSEVFDHSVIIVDNLNLITDRQKLGVATLAMTRATCSNCRSEREAGDEAGMKEHSRKWKSDRLSVRWVLITRGMSEAGIKNMISHFYTSHSSPYASTGFHMHVANAVQNRFRSIVDNLDLVDSQVEILSCIQVELQKGRRVFKPTPIPTVLSSSIHPAGEYQALWPAGGACTWRILSSATLILESALRFSKTSTDEGEGSQWNSAEGHRDRCRKSRMPIFVYIESRAHYD